MGGGSSAGSLLSSLEGVHTAYYLIHSMGSSGDFEESDRIAARNFVAAANRVGVRRIVYLGGLGDPSESLSTHLRSRQETGEILRSGRAQVVEFRASIIIGSGSLSFEIGGPDRVSYRAIMRAYARQRELRRWMVPVPLLTSATLEPRRL